MDFRDCLQEAYAQDALDYVQALDCPAEHLQPMSHTPMSTGGSPTGSSPTGSITPSPTCSNALPPNDPLLPPSSANFWEEQRRRKHANLNRRKKKGFG
ncbi:hypothetical protein PHLCEN_2v3187 [Hermanssonia centrifuga]|uniref:Uncharacterized protein n=1 Tax=Hermanssonia centrifuga TaxID=98765 RepID=A0A2R6R0Y5_9APHY|nr:hypothetical protein PHLCEN_2v3187 [Hermanssonia centrifuga]